MKKVILFAASALMLAGCSNDVELDSGNVAGTRNTISFQVGQKNTTRGKSALNSKDHYNFGVFAYKSSDKVNNIMDNYLVGYYDADKAYSSAGTTVGDQEGLVDGASYWMYEGLGYAEFTGTYAGQRLNAGDKYASNVANQYLKYWDKAAASTAFYAYAPYVNSSTAPVTYVDGQAVGASNDTYVMTFPNGTLKHGYDDASLSEFMYASTKVESANYGHDVALNFNRLNAKVNIKFWEDIPGYNVRIIDVNDAYSVAATPSIKKESDDATTQASNTYGNYGYRLGKIYTENGAKIKFTNVTTATIQQFAGTTVQTPINFAAPTDAKIGEQRIEATPSTTTYYAIPKGNPTDVLKNDAKQTDETQAVDADLAKTGLTFHVSYELISTTGEVITVKDATVFVPTDYTNWQANTHYTYIFKITKNSNGKTDTSDPKPTDPEVPTEPALYPIIFDNCTVEDWKESESEHVISDGTTAAYHDVQLSTYSIQTGAATDVTVTVTDNDTYAGHTIDYSKVTVAGPDAADENTWYNSTSHKISVPASATAGLYTVTYTCTPGSIQYNNHPTTWTETFVVGNAYTVNTNLDKVGTHGLAANALSISATKDGAAFTPTAAQLSIEYPVNLSAAEKGLVKVTEIEGTPKTYKVDVAKTATPGKYKLVLKIDEGTEVKVAEKVFEVKDYQHALSANNIYLNGSEQTITVSHTGSDDALSLDETVANAGKVTIDGFNVKVANDTPEGVYNVYYTVNRTDAASIVTYLRSFEVHNTYTVALSKNTLNTTVGAPNAAEYGTDYITITSEKNGVADELSAATAAKYTIEGLDAANYTITYVAAAGSDPACIKLQVKKSVAAGNYKVVYTGQSGKTATATFTVQK